MKIIHPSIHSHPSIHPSIPIRHPHPHPHSSSIPRAVTLSAPGTAWPVVGRKVASDYSHINAVCAGVAKNVQKKYRITSINHILLVCCHHHVYARWWGGAYKRSRVGRLFFVYHHFIYWHDVTLRTCRSVTIYYEYESMNRIQREKAVVKALASTRGQQVTRSIYSSVMSDTMYR